MMMVVEALKKQLTRGGGWSEAAPPTTPVARIRTDENTIIIHEMENRDNNNAHVTKRTLIGP